MKTPNDNIYPIENTHSMMIEEIAKQLDANLQSGLEESSINERITKYGLNNCAELRQKSI